MEKMGDGTLGEAIDRIREIFGPPTRIALWTDYIEIVDVTSGPDGIAVVSGVNEFLEADAGHRALSMSEFESIAGEFDVELMTLDGELTLRQFVQGWNDLGAAVAAVAAASDAASALAGVTTGRIEPDSPEPVRAVPEDGGEVADLLHTFEAATEARPDILIDGGGDPDYDLAANRDESTGYAQITDLWHCLEFLEGWLLEEGLVTDHYRAIDRTREFAAAQLPGLLEGSGVVARQAEPARAELCVVLGEGDDPRQAVQILATACRKVEQAFRAQFTAHARIRAPRNARPGDRSDS
jgi:hypothetical protein